VDVPLFSRSFSEHSLTWWCAKPAHCLNVLRGEFGGDQAWVKMGSSEISSDEPPHTNGIYNLGVKEKVATVSVVGFPGWSESGIVSHAFTALGKCGTRVIAVTQAGTEYSVSFCIPEEQVVRTVRFLHGELCPDGNCP
jgi:hypothetical protein